MSPGAPLIFDLFCCSGGASRGYQRAGFRTVGVDIELQPNYPAEFIQADALWTLAELVYGSSVGGYVLADIAAFHASPPCQQFSQLAIARGDGTQHKYPNLIPQTRELLRLTGKPYVIENIERAPMSEDSVLLCGTQFGGAYKWHRKFECSFPVDQLPCRHDPRTTYASPFTNANYARIKRDFGPSPSPEARFRLLKGIDWTRNQKEGREALPPDYTAYVGGYLLRTLQGAHCGSGKAT